jgi:hypothetical protein
LQARGMLVMVVPCRVHHQHKNEKKKKKKMKKKKNIPMAQDTVTSNSMSKEYKKIL